MTFGSSRAIASTILAISGTRQRIGAGEFDDGVVDRNDRDEVRRRLYAARQRSHIR